MAGLRPMRCGAFQRDHLWIRTLRKYVNIYIHKMYFDEVSHSISYSYRSSEK